MLFENGVLSAYIYNNALISGIMVSENDWAQGFLEEYKPFLPERDRENVYRYNLAILHFRTANYAEAMRLLQQTTPREPLHNLDARRMLMRIYYDFKEWSALSSLLESTRIYIRRQKDLGYGGEHYLNLVNFLQKMLKSDLSSRKTRDILRGGIEAEKSVAEKDWLLEKLK